MLILMILFVVTLVLLAVVGLLRKTWRGRYWLERRAVNAWTWAAARCPRKVRYWVTNDAVAKATTGQYSSTDVTTLGAMDVLQRIQA